MALLSFTGSPHGGAHKLLPEWNNQPKITPTTIIDHSIVGSASGAYFYFRDKTGIESHFILGLDGVIWQLMDTGRQADANLNANRFGISIETADNGDPNNFAWTSQQLASLKWLHNKLVAVHPTIPRKKVTSCSGGGLGYHSLCPTSSSNPWTPSRGKTCPGQPIRVDQWNKILVPAFVNATPPEEVDMTEAQAKQLAQLATSVARIEAALFNGHAINTSHPIDNLFDAANKTHQALIVPGTVSAEDTVNKLFERVRNIEADVKTLLPEEQAPQ